jgi:hypothetical protein
VPGALVELLPSVVSSQVAEVFLSPRARPG